MRVSQEAMQRGHAQIVRETSTLIRERGVHGVSVADAMHAAGLTHGGFYRHFDSKDALVAAAMQAAFDEFLAPLEARAKAGQADGTFDEFCAMYLSDQHVAHPGRGCPMPALGSELAAAAPQARAAFAAGVQRAIDALQQTLEGEDRHRQAAKTLATLVGAVMLARAAGGDTARVLLDACRAEA